MKVYKNIIINGVFYDELRVGFVEEESPLTDAEVEATHLETDALNKALTAEEERMVNSVNLSIR